MDDLSPRYQMKLIQKIENKLQDEFTDIQDISYYIEKWHQSWDGIVLEVKKIFIFMFVPEI